MTITQHLLDTDGTVIKQLTGLADRGWTHPLRGAGAGSLTIRNDHPDYSALTERRFIRCSLDGTPVFTWMLQRKAMTRLSQSGPGGKVTVWTGAGALSALGMGDHHSAVVVGDGDTGLKTIGWIAEDWDDSAWSEPTHRGFVGDGPDDGEWPDPDAQYLGSAQGGAPSYLRRYMDTSLRPTIVSDDIPTRLYLIAKGAWTAWWDGRQIASGDPFTVVTVEIGPLSATGHQFAMEVESGSGAMSLCALDADNEVTGVLYRSFTQGIYGTGSAEPWVGKESGGAPAEVTAGLAADRLLSAAQTRGALDGITWGFTDTVDTDGAAWSVSVPILRYRDGQQIGDVIQQMRHQFSVDVQMSPGLVLQMYDSLGTDRSGTVTATDGTARAAAATLERQGTRANATRIGTAGGYGWDPSASGVPTGESQRLETAASFGTAASTDEVVNAAQELADDLRETVRQQLVTSGPSGFRPYTTFDVGDSIGVRETSGGSYLTSRVVQATVLDLPAGEQEFIIETERRV